ncbi:MAG: hypothetical protein ABTQ34_09860 [Bdellovibrionales bacterium]
MTYEQYFEEIQALRRYLTAAQDVIKTGFLPNLNGFDERIALLCGQLQEEDSKTQERCLPELTALLVALDDCGKDMKSWHATAITAARERGKDQDHGGN